MRRAVAWKVVDSLWRNAACRHKKFPNKPWKLIGLGTVFSVSVVAFSGQFLNMSECDTLKLKTLNENDIHSIRKLRPDLSSYTRIDEALLEPEYRSFVENHALHDTLNGDNKVEEYEIYKKNDLSEIVCVIKFGSALNGHPGIVHGGITALLFDNTFGWLFTILKVPMAFTANLNINYRSPIYAGSVVLLRAKLDKMEGRKLFMNATMESEEGKIMAESTTLFIIARGKENAGPANN